MGIFSNWRKNRDGSDTPQPVRPTGQTGSYRQRLTDTREAEPQKSAAEPDLVDFDPHFHGTLETVGPGKNIFTPKHVLEETGPHDTLRIVDDTHEKDEQDTFDPYNTGRFDMARHRHPRKEK